MATYRLSVPDFRAALQRSEQVVFDRLTDIAQRNLDAMAQRSNPTEVPTQLDGGRADDALALRILLDLQQQIDKNNRDIRRLECLLQGLLERR